MKRILELEISDVYGGDGITRQIETKETKLSRKKERKTTKSSTGVSSGEITGEEKEETKIENVLTFKYDDKGNPVLRLGGAYGKFWGTMKKAGLILCDTIGKDFSTKTAVNNMMDVVQIFPVEVSLKPLKKIEEVRLPQLLNGMHKSMIEQKFDVIPLTRCTLELEYPDILDDKVVRILEQVQRMSTFNKRRARIKILKGL